MQVTGDAIAAHRRSDPWTGTPQQPYRRIAVEELPTIDGFRGIWYYNQRVGPPYHYKYSGGFATYPQQLVAFAEYRPEVEKTFFIYGGTRRNGSLLHCLSYYDHRTGRVARPRVLLDKLTRDAHDNPVLSIDDDGYLWTFSNTHGTAGMSYIHRSKRPYGIDDFELVRVRNFSYGQPWHLSGQGFVFLHTLYASGRGIYVSRSPAGRDWTEPFRLIDILNGSYEISRRHGDTIGMAFNIHPNIDGQPVNRRTNLYYMATTDGGRTWQNAGGEPLQLPLGEVANDALVFAYARPVDLEPTDDAEQRATRDRGHPTRLSQGPRVHPRRPPGNPVPGCRKLRSRPAGSAANAHRRRVGW